MKLLLTVQTTEIDSEVYKALVTIFVMVIVLYFLIIMLKKVLDYRLKNKIINREINNDLVDALLQTESNNEMRSSIKWFVILISVGLGLFITNEFLPLGIHSIGIMTIAISTGFLIYSIYLKNFDQ